MKRFNYMSEKLNAKRTTEEQAREIAQAERNKAQEQVDEVLYQNPLTARGGSSSDQPKKQNPLDTHDFVRNGDAVDASVKVTEPPSDFSKQSEEMTQPKVSTHTNRHEDADVEDFKKNINNASDDDAVEFVPKNKVEVEPPDISYQKTEGGLSPDEAVDEYDAHKERKRQAGEAVLRERISQSNKKNPAKPLRNVYDNKSEEIPMSHLKKFPTDLALRAKMLFPEATTMDEAVAAYIYFKEGKPGDLNVPDRIKEVAECFIGESVSVQDAQDEILKELMQLKMHDRAINQNLETLKLAVIYTLFDHIGFRKNEQTSPGAVDFLEQGVSDMLNRLEKQSKLKQTRDAQRNGRPIK